jgi:pilus assembly protein Flp/PilA
MIELYIKARDAFSALRMDKDGVVSMEYVVLAACIVGVVAAVFGGGAGGPLGTALSGAITTIAGQVTNAVTGG